MTVKVSIISAIYNSEKWLEECIESLVNQTLKDIEIILVNDASPDNSLDILKAYKNKYPNLIKLIDLKENIGGGGALNRGLEIANGEYVNFVDPDDYVDLNMCEKLYLKAEKDEADIVQFNYINFYEDGARIPRSHRNNKLGGSIPSEFFKEGVMVDSHKKDIITAGMGVGTHWTRFYRADLISKVKFPQNNHWFDWPMLMQPILLASTITKLEEVLYYYRIRPGSATHTKNKDKWKDHFIEGAQFVVQEFIRLGLYDRYKEYIITFASSIVYDKVVRSFFCKMHFYKANSDIYKFIDTLEKHIKYMESIYPNYADRLFSFCKKKDKLKLKLLFSYPKVLKVWLDYKFFFKGVYYKVKC